MPNWLEIALMAAVSLFLITKLLGKRQVSQLSVFEYVTGITIGSLAGYVSMDLKANWYIGLISLAVWVSVSSGVEFVQLKSKMIRNWIDGKSTVLIKDGKILQDNLKKERLNSDELMMLPEEQAPQALIMDGHILEQTITAIGRDELWLKEELSKLGVRI